jgi:hypothetical protein
MTDTGSTRLPKTGVDAGAAIEKQVGFQDNKCRPFGGTSSS